MQATIEVAVLECSSRSFPQALQAIPDSPQRLFVAGTLPSDPAVAIVGSRRMTSYGRRVTQQLSARLASAGVPVVSGLAFGVDAAVHRAVLDAGGRSVALLPGGLSLRTISPRAHLSLAKEILRQGALVSEYPPEVTARKEHFLARNRLIAGLSRVTVVVEAMLPSGSLITAKHALDQGREVWAVPGPIDSPTSAGTNWLISDGAMPLTNIDHFLEAVGAAPSPAKAAHPLLKHFRDKPVHRDQLHQLELLSPTELEAELTKLELLGLVRHVGGGYYGRV